MALLSSVLDRETTERFSDLFRHMSLLSVVPEEERLKVLIYSDRCLCCQVSQIEERLKGGSDIF